MNDYSNKMMIKIIGVLSILLAVMVYDKFSSNDVQQKGSDYVQLDANLVQAKTEIVDKIDLVDIDQTLASAIKPADLTSLNTILSTQKAAYQTRTALKSKNILRYGTKAKELLWRNSSNQELPVGVAIYSPKKDLAGKDPWLAKTWQIDFHSQSVRTVGYDGTVRNTLTTWATTPSRKEYKGVKYKIDIKDAVYQEVHNKNKLFSLWNPTLSLGLLASNNVTTVMAKLNVINYGYKKQLPVYQFVSPVVQYSNNTLNFGAEAVSYNLGELLPVIKDLHVGAGIMMDKSVFIGISSVL